MEGYNVRDGESGLPSALPLLSRLKEVQAIQGLYVTANGVRNGLANQPIQAFINV